MLIKNQIKRVDIEIASKYQVGVKSRANQVSGTVKEEKSAKSDRFIAAIFSINSLVSSKLTKCTIV